MALFEEFQGLTKAARNLSSRDMCGEQVAFMALVEANMMDAWTGRFRRFLRGRLPRLMILLILEAMAFT